MTIVLQQLVLGVLIGGLYGLAAAGLSLIFGVMKVLNVAHGELIMLGGYGAFWLFALSGLDPFAALVVVIPVALVGGAILYWGLFGWVVRYHEETRIKNSLLIGFGLGLALHAAAVQLWTADERSITTAYAGSVLDVGGVSLPVVRLASLVIAFVLIGGLHLLLNHWRWGRAIRATADDWEAALMTGIDVRRAYLIAFAIGTALAGAAGTLVIAGYAGQVNLGHAAFFGLGALVTRVLWIAGTPVVIGMIAGALVAVAFALLIGWAAFRLRGAYFAIGTLALSEIFRITVGNTLAEISTLPQTTIATYRLANRYWLALALAVLAIAAVAALARSRLGLGMQAIREDEDAAGATGVDALRLKLIALVCSTALAGLVGGCFAYYHISFYPSHLFSPGWTFDAVLMTFIGGVGTLHGPVLGAIFYVFFKEYLAIRWVDFHLLIFGALFVAIVLLLPGGLVEAMGKLRGLLESAAFTPDRRRPRPEHR